MILNIYIGYDTTNDGQLLAYEICKKSILLNTKHPNKINIFPLIKKQLEEINIYYRKDDKLAATEFTYTRFLAPLLNNYKDFCLFCDSDFLWQCDIYEEFLPLIIENKKAIYCVKHNYIPKEEKKMDGRIQSIYPRKNWSSLILFNCGHENVKNLTKENVNLKSPAWLHRMQWCDDDNIGELPHTYNYLVGVYKDILNPKAIHYTDGGPWHLLYKKCDFYENWLGYLDDQQLIRLKTELERQKINFD